MRVIIEPNYEKLSKWAATYVANRINEAKPTAEKPFKLGCPTGSSPLGLYKELIAMNKAGKVSFEHVITFNMDEYVNLPEAHPESYHSFMWNNFFNHINIKKENVHILNGNAPDLIAECEAYEKAIEDAANAVVMLCAYKITPEVIKYYNEDYPYLVVAEKPSSTEVEYWWAGDKEANDLVHSRVADKYKQLGHYVIANAVKGEVHHG